MCGILGEITAQGAAVDLTQAQAESWLERLAHRGPDGRGQWRARNVFLGHTRLAVRDPGNAGAAQPMVTPCGRFALVYNGELYNDAQVRASLEPVVRSRTSGRGFTTTCDAETVLWALALRGPDALSDLRGMYALAFVDLQQNTLLLARDPLGVKPLVWARTERGLAFASEPQALVAHPRVRRAPDPEMVSAYLATSRRVLAGRTMFAGVETLLPGEVLTVDLNEQRPLPRALLKTATHPAELPSRSDSSDAETCRRIIEDSTRRHLVSDVPICALLSGGLDSTILTAIIAEQRPDLATWCASGIENGVEVGPDPSAARSVAARLGTRHTDVSIDRDTFVREWEAHVAHLGQPLSTPNEVAIAETSRAIRRSGAIVTLSGEGADELFGGYDVALAAFAAHGELSAAPISAARFHLEATAWISPAAQEALLTDGARSTGFVVDAFERTFAACARGAATDLDAHLRLQRAINLTSLLDRLDAASMRHGVEGRTPFADDVVARYAESLPMDAKFVAVEGGAHRSKIVLRDAFRHAVPPAINQRPKASFPLPFERWSAALVDRIAASSLVRETVHREVIETVEANPVEQWKLTWLLGNLALWDAAVFESSQPRVPVTAA